MVISFMGRSLFASKSACISWIVHRAGRAAAHGEAYLGRALDAGGYLLVDAERLSYHLVHVVILVGRQTAHEMYVFGRIGERLVFLVKLGVFGARDGVVRVAVLTRVLADDAGLGVLLTRQVLELGNARVGVVVGEVDRACLLVQRHIEGLELELERPVRQLAVAVVEKGIYRACVD